MIVATKDALWQAYRTSHGVEDRNALVEAYLPMVKALARRLHSRLPACVDWWDLCVVGVMGLMEAIPRVDPAGRPRAFLAARARGAMIDERPMLFTENQP
ncbi:MAG: sigma-70 family RNA polymerase sigma factor [Thermoguttaceae bacterium]